MRIRRLHFTDVTAPPSHPRAGAVAPVYCYVVDHPDGPIVFDTGVGTGRDDVDTMFGCVHHHPPVPEPVLVVNSHLHFDHCGGNRRWPGVPIVAQQAEHDAIHEPRYTLPEWADPPGVVWRLVDGDADVADGVRVIATPGHTAGHQSLVIAGAGGPVVLAGQAVYDPGELEAEASVEPLPAAEAVATTESARRIKALRPSRVLFAHHPGEWRPAGHP